MVNLVMFCLAVVALLCAVGCFSPHYPDNFLQRLGMAGIGISCGVLVDHVRQMGTVNEGCGLLAVGMLAYALGTAAKVVKHMPAPADDAAGCHAEVRHR
jgi:hypothetical protein